MKSRFQAGANRMVDAADHRYSEEDRKTVYRVIAERRDMRHFKSDVVDPNVLLRLLQAAHRAPSVGLMQPWRFIRITDPSIKEQLHASVERERVNTAEALGEKKDDFLRLKVEGVLDCAELLIAALPDGREKHVFGRRTLPEMDLASLACAIQNMWLAARAEGLGMGWVSIFDPQELKDILGMPAGSRPVAILCLGHVEAFYPEPMLVTEQWATERPLSELVFHDTWDNKGMG